MSDEELIIKKIFIGIVAFFAILCFYCIVIHDKTKISQETNNNNNNDEKKVLTDHDKAELDFDKRLDNLESVLLELDYQKRDECYHYIKNIDSYCYSNGNLEVIKSNRGTVSFSKLINNKNLANYKSKSDLESISEILEYESISSMYSNVDKVISLISEGATESVSLFVDEYYLNISKYTSHLVYEFNNPLWHNTFNVFYPVEITFYNGSEASNSQITKMRKELYDMAIASNKKYFKFYDYPYLFFNKETYNNYCYIDINNKEDKDGYLMSSSFCHWGSSNTSFDFEKTSDNYDYVKIGVRDKYFEDNYLEIIKRDLEYFKNKLDKELQLDDSNIDKLVSFMQSKENTVLIMVNDDLIIHINRSVKTSKLFYLNYEFN